MKFLEILAQIRNVLSKGAGAELAFGKPTQVNDLTVIPVARISMSVGGGGGSSPMNPKKSKKPNPTPESQTGEPSEAPVQEPKSVNEGGGGGGQVKTSPLGIYVIKGDKVKFYPLVGVREILIATGVISWLLIRIVKLKTKKRK